VSPPSSPERRDETLELLREYARTRDVELRNRVVLLHQGIAHRLAARLGEQYGCTREDLAQVAVIGLIAAVERFDTDAGTTFLTFAVPTITGLLKHYLRDHTWLIKVPRRQREQANRVRRLASRLEVRLGRSPTVSELAEAAGIAEERVLELMEIGRLHQPDSLDRLRRPDETGEGGTVGETLGYAEGGFREVEAHDAVRRALGHLKERERRILLARYQEGKPQAEVALEMGISQMHVSRLERAALRRLREILE
jgi:RNA polymerase sigma-B factor